MENYPLDRIGQGSFFVFDHLRSGLPHTDKRFYFVRSVSKRETPVAVIALEINSHGVLRKLHTKATLFMILVSETI